MTRTLEQQIKDLERRAKEAFKNTENEFAAIPKDIEGVKSDILKLAALIKND